MKSGIRQSQKLIRIGVRLFQTLEYAVECMLSMKDKEKVPQWVKVISEEALLLFMHLCFHKILTKVLIKRRKKKSCKILMHQINIPPHYVHIVLRIIE